MICPKCGGQNVSILPVTETKNKTRWGCGCLVTPLAFLFPKRQSTTHTEAVCQHCGNRWRVTGLTVRNNVSMPQANGYAPQYAPSAPPTRMTALPPQPNINAPVPTPNYSHQQHSVPPKPFYKETWFMFLCGWWFWLVEIAIWLFAKPARIAYMFIKNKIQVDAEPFDITRAGNSEAVDKLQRFSIYSTQFYKTKWFFIVLCVFFPYIAILIMLIKKQNWKLWVKISISAVLVLWWIFWSGFWGGMDTSNTIDTSPSDLPISADVTTNSDVYDESLKNPSNDVVIDDNQTLDQNDSADQQVEQSELQANTKLGNCEVNVISHRFGYNWSGEKIVFIKYSFTNNSDEATSFMWTIDDSVFQNGIELEKEYLLDDDNYDPSLSDAKIQPGITLELEEVYVLRDETTPLMIELTRPISFSDNKLTFTIDLA